MKASHKKILILMTSLMCVSLMYFQLMFSLNPITDKPLLNGVDSIISYAKLSGETMGTSYHISFALPKEVNTQDDEAIKTTHANIHSQLEVYEQGHSIPTDELRYYYRFLELSPDEIRLIEQYGLNITKENKGYKVTVSYGLSFDEYAYYKTAEKCWYSNNVSLLWLRKCTQE